MIDSGHLRKLLIDQYLLHEVQHHFSSEFQGDASVPREPRAHALVDIYKCLHQGEFGVGHLIDDPVRFRKRLLHELLQILPSSAEPTLENVSINNTVMRLNLRPFKAIFKAEIEEASHLLAEVCIESSKTVKGDPERFFYILNGFRDLNREGELRVSKASYSFPIEMVDYFLMEVRKLANRLGEIPVFSHSSIYRQLNEPSYRVVDISAVEKSELAFLLEKGQKGQP
jgi:hypothetical protein